MESKFIVAACGEFRSSTWHRPQMNDAETMDASADGLNKWDRSLSSKGAVKETADECKYNCFII